MLLVLLLATPAPVGAQSAPAAPREPGTYVVSVADGSVRRVGSEATVAWSPDGRLLAVAEIGQDAPTGTLRILDLVSGAETPIALPAPGQARELSWAPDGSHLAFVFSPLGSAPGLGVYVLSRAQGSLQQILPFGGMLAWTPDSRAVTAVQLQGPPQNGRIVTVDASTGNVLATIREGEITCVEGLAWSPDGAYLAVGGPGLTQGCPPSPDLGVWSWQADSGSVRQLYARPATRPLWTPDGDVLAQVVGGEPTRPSLGLVRLRPDGSGTQVLVDDIPRSFAPAFRPFQSVRGAVIFSVVDCDIGAVFGLSAGSTQARQLSPPSSFVHGANLSPDGATVAWTARSAAGESLVLAGLDTGGERTLLQGAPGLTTVTWAPDSRALAFTVATVGLELPCGPR
jgi:Tol biopolymer transport system component